MPSTQANMMLSPAPAISYPFPQGARRSGQQSQSPSQGRHGDCFGTEGLDKMQASNVVESKSDDILNHAEECSSMLGFRLPVSASVPWIIW